MEKNTFRYTPGAYVEITEDINAIPKGVYRLDYRDQETFGFTLGKANAPYFIVSDHARHLLRPVSYREGSIRRTTKSDFLERYYSLLSEIKESKQTTSSSLQPITLCGISQKDHRLRLASTLS